MIEYTETIPPPQWWRNPILWLRRWRAIRFARTYIIAEDIVEDLNE